MFWFIGETAAPEEVVPLAGLFSVATCDWLSDLNKMGIPEQLIHRVYEDYGQIRLPIVRQHAGEKCRIACLLPPGVNKVRQLLELISLFNLLTRVELYIYCTIEESLLLKQFTNEHLSFLLHEDKAITCAYHLVITYGSGALHFIKNEIPVIISGPYGFGGLVTTENFPYLLKNGFCGRPGGTFGEPVPLGILRDELDIIGRMEELSVIAKNVRKLADNLSYRPLSAIGEIREQTRLLYETLYDDRARWGLRPMLASTIQIVQKQPQILLRRAAINDTVAIIQEGDLDLFRQMNGEHTCRHLLAYSKIQEDAFWKLIYVLWDKKIIVF